MKTLIFHCIYACSAVLLFGLSVALYNQVHSTHRSPLPRTVRILAGSLLAFCICNLCVAMVGVAMYGRRFMVRQHEWGASSSSTEDDEEEASLDLAI